MMSILSYVYISASTAHMLGVVKSIDKKEEKKRTQSSRGIDPVC